MGTGRVCVSLCVVMLAVACGGEDKGAPTRLDEFSQEQWEEVFLENMDEGILCLGFPVELYWSPGGGCWVRESEIVEFDTCWSDGDLLECTAEGYGNIVCGLTPHRMWINPDWPCETPASPGDNSEALREQEFHFDDSPHRLE